MAKATSSQTLDYLGEDPPAFLIYQCNHFMGENHFSSKILQFAFHNAES